MAFTDTQLKALDAPLDRKNVRQREQAGRKFSYVEGWHAIAEANRIFGFDAWDRETVEIRLLGERQVGDKNRVAYMARVRITVRADGATIIRDGCGYGSGIDKDIGQAHESALKEAETDAMKRGLMTFGNPFGLALYDKEQTNVADVPEHDPLAEAAARYITDCERAIDAETNRTTLIEWWNGDQRKDDFRKFQLTPQEGKALTERIQARAKALAGNAQVAA